MQTHELICINCPLGCALTVTMDDNGEVLSVEGNTCPRGDAYARKELTSPTRIVCSSVPVSGSKLGPMVSVKTASDIPKGKIFDVMAQIRATRVEAPVRIGDVVVANVAGTGVDVVATRDA